jgi:hypothetical protein
MACRQGSTRRHTTLDSTLVAKKYGLAAPDPWIVIDKSLKPPEVGFR